MSEITDEDTEQPDDLLYEAWGVIANASDWIVDSEQARQWQAAAIRWRDRWHATLHEKAAVE